MLEILSSGGQTFAPGKPRFINVAAHEDIFRHMLDISAPFYLLFVILQISDVMGFLTSAGYYGRRPEFGGGGREAGSGVPA